jgi:hypothetical protein
MLRCQAGILASIRSLESITNLNRRFYQYFTALVIDRNFSISIDQAVTHISGKIICDWLESIDFIELIADDGYQDYIASYLSRSLVVSARASYSKKIARAVAGRATF